MPSAPDLLDPCHLCKPPLCRRRVLLFARSCSEFSTLRRYAFRPAVGLAVLARTVRVHVCMILCIDAYLYAPVSVHHGYTCTYSHRQTGARTYAHAHAPARPQAPSFRPLTAQPAPAEAVRGVRWQVGDSDDGDDGYDTTGTNDEDVQFNQADQVSVTAAASLPNGRRSRPRSSVPARRSAPPPLCHLGGQRVFPAGGAVGSRYDCS